jgi:hypothetical protein
MKSFDLKSACVVAALALLAACGGGTPSEQADLTRTAGVMAHAAAPVADCEAEGCNQPRIVDGLAEQYRFGAIQQPRELPAEPAAAAAPAPEAIQVATATEATPAAAVQVQ